jgi:hypothetical protein
LTLIVVPIKGTLLEIREGKYIVGDDNDPIEPVVNLGIPWRLVELDLPNELAVVSVDVKDFDHERVDAQERIASAILRADASPRQKRLVWKDP